MMINGFAVGKVFANFVFPKTFQYIGSIIGGVVGGAFVDKYANILAGKDDSLLQRILNNAKGTFFGKFLELLRGL